MSNVARHYDGNAAGYHEQYDPNTIARMDADYPANYFRLEKVARLLQTAGATSVYDFGAGEATPIIRLHEKLGIQVAGSDFSPNMVALGKENLQRHGLDPDLFSLMDIQDKDAVAKERAARGEFDAVIALGVIPHVTDDHGFVQALSAFCKPGGTLVLQFRNSMFSMYTFNRLTKEFILDELMAPVPQQFKDAMADELDGRLAVNLPPVRRREDGFGYDEVLSRFHNPFELSDIVREEGFTDLKLHWYNYHPTPPMISSKFDPREYRQAQIDLESDTSWRGMFMCSAGFIEATKK